MSKFFGYLITGILIISLGVFIFSLEVYWFFVLKLFIIYLFFFWVLLLSGSLSDFVVLKYRIQVGEYSIHAHYLGLLYFFIPSWKPVAKEYHSYKAGNLFGAKWTSTYTTEMVYKTENGARESIEQHKIKMRKQRAEFFKRKVKEKIKTTYL